MTELTKGQKISDALKGRVIPDETRRKMSDAKTGRKHARSTRLKIAAARTGTIHSIETKQKISAGMTAAWSEGRAGAQRRSIPEVVTLEFETPDAKATYDRLEAILELAEQHNGTWSHNGYRTWKTDTGWSASVSMTFEDKNDAIIFKLALPE